MPTVTYLLSPNQILLLNITGRGYRNEITIGHANSMKKEVENMHVNYEQF